MSAVLVVLLFLVCSWLVVGIRRYRKFRGTCEAAFTEAFASADGSPQLKIGTAYGFPSFQVTFLTGADVASARARGLTERFAAQIQHLCDDRGFEDRPFDAELAIWFTSQEELGNIQKKYGRPDPGQTAHLHRATRPGFAPGASCARAAAVDRTRSER